MATARGTQFAHEAAARGERSVVYLVEERAPTTRARSQAVNIPVREMIEAAWTIAADKADEAELIYEQANDRALIEADPDRLRQVFENLLTNAIEHAGPDVTVRVETTDTGFAIEDDGPGVPRENRHRVFDTGHTTAQQGTGLGLSIVEQIVEGHDWDIRITDANNGGARFEITGVEFVEA